MVEYTKTFTTTIIVGEDVVGRLGLRQLENLRADLIHVLKESEDPKWKTLSYSIMRCCCCGCRPHRMPNHNIQDYKEVSFCLRFFESNLYMRGSSSKKQTLD